MAVGVGICSCTLTSEITAEDKEARQKWIDNMVQQLTSSGVGEAKAKRQAAGMFDEVHPWYKQGSTRGKQ